MAHQTLAHRRFLDPPPSPDALIAALAARQHGVVRLAQLLAAGLDESAVARRVAAGRLHRVYRGVYAVGHRGLSREGRWMAAVLAAGEGAALSHLCAACLWELKRLRTDFVDVVAPKRRTPKGPVRVHASRTLHDDDIVIRRGIPVTTVARMLVDLTDTSTPHELANLMHEAEFRSLLDLAAIDDAMTRANGRRNLAVLEQALELHDTGSAGVKSANERAFLRLAGRPEPLTNVLVLGEEVDAYWPDLRLVVEIDGTGHRRRRTRLDDDRRDAKLRASGYRVLRFTDTEVHERPDWVRARLAAARET